MAHKKATAASVSSESELDFELLTAVNGVIHQCAADVPYVLYFFLITTVFLKELFYAGCIPGISEGGYPTRPTFTTYAIRLRATTDTLRVDHSSCRYYLSSKCLPLQHFPIFFAVVYSLLRMKQTVKYWRN